MSRVILLFCIRSLTLYNRVICVTYNIPRIRYNLNFAEIHNFIYNTIYIYLYVNLLYNTEPQYFPTLKR